MLLDRFVMLFDGRIDNRSELGQILGISPSDLHSMPDSEIALRLFDRLGERAFERILGVFAIIIMDLQEGRLLCARDHLGLRVLHYHRSPGRFAVATVPEALFALSWVPRILNKEKLANDSGWRPSDLKLLIIKTFFACAPGSTVRVCGANFSKRSVLGP